jgi:hypothetical protein
VTQNYLHQSVYYAHGSWVAIRCMGYVGIQNSILAIQIELVLGFKQVLQV